MIDNNSKDVESWEYENKLMFEMLRCGQWQARTLNTVNYYSNLLVSMLHIMTSSTYFRFIPSSITNLPSLSDANKCCKGIEYVWLFSSPCNSFYCCLLYFNTLVLIWETNYAKSVVTPVPWCWTQMKMKMEMTIKMVIDVCL